MSALNREEIIKALEKCVTDSISCTSCPLEDYSPCSYIMAENALACIKELIEENERLRNSSVDYRNIPDIKAKERADTVREIETRLAMRYGTYTDKDMTPITEVFWLLDQIAKEMLEG